MGELKTPNQISLLPFDTFIEFLCILDELQQKTLFFMLYSDTFFFGLVCFLFCLGNYPGKLLKKKVEKIIDPNGTLLANRNASLPSGRMLLVAPNIPFMGTRQGA